MKNVFLSVLLILAASCAGNKKETASQVSKESKSAKQVASLSLEDSISRKERVSNVSYNLQFDLTTGEESFAGVVAIEFDLEDSDDNLRVDFNKGKVLKITVNGMDEKIEYNDVFINISAKYLKDGYNELNIAFTHDYSKDGSGLYRFVDQEDKRVYTYSDLEPYDANRIFPSFDQPNLKATYEMQVKTFKNWVVSTYALETSTKIVDMKKVWTFPRSAKFSTYIWSLHAGEYAVVSDKKAKYPSRLFMRQSMKKYVNINDWQTFTRQSFEFLDEYFGVPYPYQKYDQLIVPDFNAGAMENVAAVTFAERYVSRGQKTQKLRYRHANVVFHEMAHMWFGNLVTMDWWNDLWLNESFATYIANLGVSRNTEFANTAWRHFNGTKQWAYWEDQLVTTHPIVTEVPDTNQAFANFDGITYGKGASSLKQIHYYLGEEAFKKGLRIYFRRHATQNTTLADFMKALSEGAGYDLTDWKEKWLESTGVNTVSIMEKTCENGLLKSMTLEQSKSSGDTYRPHSFEVALLKTEDNALKVYQSKKVKMEDETIEIKDFQNTACPEVVYANYNDHDYLGVDLDADSLKVLQESIYKVEDNFLRQMMWTEIWKMVYYGRYSYKRFHSMALAGLREEQDAVILDNLLGVMSTEGRGRGIRPLAFHDPNLSDKDRVEMNRALYSIVKTRLESSQAGSEPQKLFYRTLVSLSQEKDQLDYLINILEGKKRFAGLKIDQDKRWVIVMKLKRFNHPLKDQKLEKERRRDNSSRAQKMMIAIDALGADTSIKNKWINSYKNEDKNYSFSQLKQAMYNLFPMEQKQIKEEIFDTYLSELGPINDTKEGHIAMTFARNIPTTCTQAHSEKIAEYIEDNSSRLKAGVLKNLRIALQENDRCIKSITIAK